MYRRERVGRKRAVTEGNGDAVVGVAGSGGVGMRGENGAPAGAGWISAVGRRGGREGEDGGERDGGEGVNGREAPPLPPPAYMPRERNDDGGAIEMGDFKIYDSGDGGGKKEEGPQTAMGERMARGSWPSTIASWER